jgi:hypothetical protein
MIWLRVAGDGIQMAAAKSCLSRENYVFRLTFSLLSINVTERKLLPPSKVGRM